MNNNPMEAILQRMGLPVQAMNNPIIKNAMQMQASGNSQGLSQLAHNVCRERGLDADELMKRFGMK